MFDLNKISRKTQDIFITVRDVISGRKDVGWGRGGEIRRVVTIEDVKPKKFHFRFQIVLSKFKIFSKKFKYFPLFLANCPIY